MRNKLWLTGCAAFAVAALVLNRGPDRPDPEASPPHQASPPSQEKERSLFSHDGLIQHVPALNAVFRVSAPLAAEAVSSMGLLGLSETDSSMDAQVQKGGVRYGAELATAFTFNSAISAVTKGGFGFGRDSAGF
jgi:hypothetical protein